MINTPYFDAYENYRKSKLKFIIDIKKTFTTINGQKVLSDINFVYNDDLNNYSS